jgi:hypothetical protein
MHLDAPAGRPNVPLTPNSQGINKKENSRKPALFKNRLTHRFMSDHCVKVILKLSDGDMGSSEERDAIHELSDTLQTAIEENEAGEFDGDEFGGGECVLYMYGTDADRLFEAIRPALKASPLAPGGHAVLRYGPPEDGIKEVQVEL